jgi:hypothetical protein
LLCETVTAVVPVMSNLRLFIETSDDYPSVERRQRMRCVLREAEGHEVPLKIQVGVAASRNWRSTSNAVSLMRALLQSPQFTD